jgi:hypothetical protein
MDMQATDMHWGNAGTEFYHLCKCFSMGNKAGRNQWDKYPIISTNYYTSKASVIGFTEAFCCKTLNTL